MITPFPPSPTPELNPHYPLRTPQVLYWYHPYPLGHTPEADRKAAEHTYYMLTYELGPLVQGGGLGMNVLHALQVLDDLIYPIAIAFPFELAMKTWLKHVQEVIGALKMYAFYVPLKPSEKNLIVNFALYWSQKRGGPLCMGAPAAQIVVHTLMELGQSWEGEFCKVEQREDVAVY